MSQGQEAYQRLIADIGAGALAPGARLLESEIAQRLGISRTPVREAIRRLEAEGLVVHMPRTGAAVRRLDPAEISELYEMRGVLEGAAARLAARTASEVDIAELAAINAEMGAAFADLRVLYDLNRQFHAALVNAARNRFLARSVEGLRTTLLILGPSTMEDGSRAAEAVAEHDEVLAAVRARDETAAEAAMRRHIAAAHGVRLRQFRSRSVEAEAP